jgi:hypothetical protein
MRCDDPNLSVSDSDLIWSGCRRRSNRPHSRGRSEMDRARTDFKFAFWLGVLGRGFGAPRRPGGGTGRIAGGIGNSGRHRRAQVGMGNCTAPELCCSPKISSTRAKPACSKRSASPEPNKRNCWNCVPPRATPGCGASSAGAPKPAISSPGLRLVHRGLRHRRSERRKGAALSKKKLNRPQVAGLLVNLSWFCPSRRVGAIG